MNSLSSSSSSFRTATRIRPICRPRKKCKKIWRMPDVPGDLILTMGAGDIWKAADGLARLLIDRYEGDGGK